MGNPKTTTVQTENGDVIVRKLALKDYADLMRAMKKLPEEFGKFVEGRDDKTSNATLMAQAIGDMGPVALDEVCEILAIASDKEADFFKEGDLADAIDVTVAALELNDYSRIMKSVKKVMALSKKKKEKESGTQGTPTK